MRLRQKFCRMVLIITLFSGCRCPQTDHTQPILTVSVNRDRGNESKTLELVALFSEGDENAVLGSIRQLSEGEASNMKILLKAICETREHDPVVLVSRSPKIALLIKEIRGGPAFQCLGPPNALIAKHFGQEFLDWLYTLPSESFEMEFGKAFKSALQAEAKERRDASDLIPRYEPKWEDTIRVSDLCAAIFNRRCGVSLPYNSNAPPEIRAKMLGIWHSYVEGRKD